MSTSFGKYRQPALQGYAHMHTEYLHTGSCSTRVSRVHAAAGQLSAGKHSDMHLSQNCCVAHSQHGT